VAEQIALYEETNRKSQPEVNTDETVDQLRDYGLDIIQPKSGYRFSLDPLLLCDFAPAGKAAILDLGSGCGIIPLIMARKYPDAAITAVELQPPMADIARRNVEQNDLGTRIRIIEGDILALTTDFPADSFDLVLANPPYRRNGEGRVSPKAGRDIARHESSATLADFITIAKKMVKPGGSICFIYHPERLAELLSLSLRLKLAPARLQLVYGDLASPARMFLIELLKGKKAALRILPPISVKGSVYGESQQAGMKRER
jgi:tRNA1Val (adenine37-N6)-methyltransferase